mgnify:CR=1 FL=1
MDGSSANEDKDTYIKGNSQNLCRLRLLPFIYFARLFFLIKANLSSLS